MKGTRHNGRSGKNGVYNPLHNDRRFNPEHSEHIDNERVRKNIYWDCFQGYTTMEDQGKENNFSFEQIEMAFYEEHYGDYVMKRHGLELDEEPSYGGRKYLEKQDYIRMKQKEEIADQQETILMQIDKVNENRLELAKQSSHVRANEEIIQSQKEKIKQQDTEFANNSDRIFKQGDLIEEQKNQLEKLTLEIDDIESLLQDVSDVAYEKAVEEVTNEVMIKTRQDDIQLIEGTKNWIDQPQRKASEKEKNYAKNRLDGVIKKIMKAMTAVQTVKDSLLQPKTKVKVVNEIKEKARPSIMSRLAEKKKELAERETNKKNDLKKSWNRDDR